MTYLESIHQEHKARLSRLNMRAPAAGPLVRRTLPKVIPILNGKQFHWQPKPKPKPVASIASRDWLFVATGQFKAIHVEMLGPSHRPPVRGIAAIVARHFGLTLSEILSHRRAHDVVRPRQIAMYLAKRLTLDSFPQIGGMLGDRDHTTVLHGVRKIEWLRSVNAALDADVVQIERKIAEAYPAPKEDDAA